MHLKKVITIFAILTFVFNAHTNAEAVNIDDSFLENLVFPVKHIKSHFYDDWGEIRGNGERAHAGLDIKAPKGAKVVAVADGKVNTVAFSEASGYYLAIDHGNGWLSLYVHLNDDLIGDDNLGGRETAFADNIYLGAEVIAGQTIGYLGNSGNAEGTVPHIHFEIRYKNQSIPIYDYILNSWNRFEKYIKFPLNTVGFSKF